MKCTQHYKKITQCTQHYKKITHDYKSRRKGNDFHSIRHFIHWTLVIATTSWQCGNPLYWYLTFQLHIDFGPDVHHYKDVIMSTIASHIPNPTIVYSSVYSDADQGNIKTPRHGSLWGDVTGGFPAQMVSNAENVCIYWCHDEYEK